VSTQKDKYIDGQKIMIIKGDFFAVSSQFRSHSLPLMTLLQFCLQFKLKHPFEHIYYFFITYSYKSYLSFGRAMGEFWPRHQCTVPPFERKIMDILGKEAANDWGTYCPESFVIKDNYEGNKGRLKLASSLGATPETRTLAKSLEFFLENNPGHSKGDCFCVLAPVTFKNFIFGFGKAFLRIFGVGSKRTNNSNNKNVAFGMGIRKGDKQEAVVKY